MLCVNKNRDVIKRNSGKGQRDGGVKGTGKKYGRRRGRR
jgi:hypothetical protein